SYSWIISPVTFNEFRVGYNRRATSNPPRPDATKFGISIPGVSTESFPYFNIGYGIGGMTVNRNVGEDRVLQDNLTRLAGKHSIKVGYELIWTLYSDKASSLPSGQYNFGGGTALPFTPNTGIDLAGFEMGAVTSATFTQPLGIFCRGQLATVVHLPLVAQDEIHYRLRILARHWEVTLALGHQHRDLPAEFLVP